MNLFLKLYLAELDFAIVSIFLIMTLPVASISLMSEFFVLLMNAVIFSAFIEKLPFDAIAFPVAT